MPLKTVLALMPIALVSGCASVKYNSHVGSDSTTGYLRTYYASDKARVNSLSDGTGIEHCKVQGSDVICRDLNIVIVPEVPPTQDGQPLLSPMAAPVETGKAKPAPAGVKKAAAKK